MEDVTTTTVISELNRTDPNALNNSPELIIRKENFGSESYQQQQYQYNLLNNLRKRDVYYEDLAKIRDRFQKPVPTMQQVIHVDMKRVKINKIHERKLEQNLEGPRGLTWQHKQNLQRLKNTERDLTKALTRLKDKSNRIALSSNIDQTRRTSPEFSPLIKRKTRSSSIETKTNRLLLQQQNKRTTNFNANHDESYLHPQAQLIEQEKREIEQKLREFFM